MRKLITVLITLMVLTIFTVGCVSAEDVTDVEVPTEEIDVDDTVADVVENEETEIEEDSNGYTTIAANSNSGQIQSAINGGGSFIFEYGTYGDVYNITLSNDTYLDGNGSTLTGNGVDDIFLAYNCHNVTIKNFIINLNGGKHGIYGSYVENSSIINNEIYGGTDGINIYKHYSNLTIEDNIIHDMSHDGISLANPVTFNTMSDLISTSIKNNTVYNTSYAIFLGGYFKGTIENNNISNSTYGICFQGKPDNYLSQISVDILNNTITQVTTGIYLNYTNTVKLNITNNNTISTNNPDQDFVIGSGSVMNSGYFGVTGNTLNGCIRGMLVRFVINEFSNEGNITEK